MPPSLPPGRRRVPAGRDQPGETETPRTRIEAAAEETLRVEVAAVIKDRLLATIDELGQDAVLWLAAPPVWTLGAARAAAFPVQSLTEFVRRARAAGWCKARGSLLDDAPPDLLFWMPDEVRRDVADALRGRLGGQRLAEDHQEVARRVYQVTPALTSGSSPVLAGEELPGALAAWAELMTTSPLLRSWPTTSEAEGRPARPSSVRVVTDRGAGLIIRTQQAVADRDLSRAQDLVAAGEAIAGVLAGTMEQALSRAQRLLALGQRRRQDERALGRYLDRPELSDAVARLLNRDAPASGVPATTRVGGARDKPWALHLRGVGGVGKTMLIRYLASGRYAASRKLAPIPVARADFDRINPDYPVRRPVQLLLELADELALHAAASDRADQALTVFRARAARAHEAVSGLREAGGSPLRHPEVALAVDRFGDVLAELGNVLLILDTCEELAKADLGNPATPAVRATLDIIERLHQRAPTARVLFAGRRPLPERPYLAVQPVTGFTVGEARRYLATSAGRPLSAALEEEMIRQSAAVDGPVPAAGQLPERVSPFDLALYATWANEDQELDVAQVSRGSDAYVESRIVERLDDPLVVRALPVLAAGGWCRLTTIAPLLECDPGLLGRRLAEQEWVDANGDPLTHVAARPTLARRLRRYFESDERHAEFAARTAALASALLTRVQQASLAEIDVDELLAALRLAEPAAAAALWDSIADRATEPPGRWGTVLNLTRRVLGEWDEEEWPTTEALRATVTAAHIAASRRDSPLFDARGPWETVRAWAERHPDMATRRRLLARALLGLLPYTPEDESLWQAAVETASPPGPGIGAGVLAAFGDSVHRLLESGQHSAAERLFYRVLPDSSKRITRPGPQGEAWIEVASARLRADKDPEAARRALERAEGLVYDATEDEPSWPDWIPPDDLLARIRIERGLIAPPADLAVLDAWGSYAADRLDTIDGERLASLCLRIRLRHGIIDATVAERWEAADSYNADRVPTCTAHDLVPPLFVSVAQAWMSAGDPEHALAVLDRRRRAGLGTRQDDLTARHADAATVAIDRRLRLTDRQSLLSRLATERGADDQGRTALGDTQLLAWRALAVLSPGWPLGVPVPSLQLNPKRWHAWWQSRGPNTLADSAERPSASQLFLTSSDMADISVDLQEIRQLALLQRRFGVQGSSTGWESMLSEWLEQLAPPPLPPARSAEPHRALRAAMRSAALGGEPFEVPPRVPPRLVAEMAFEEAELTALRLPDAASLLFVTAADAYRIAGDPLGQSLALLSVLITGHPADGPAATRLDVAREQVDEAFRALVQVMPAVAAALDAPPAEAGPWRNWTPDSRAKTDWAQAVKGAADPGAVTRGSAALDPAPAALRKRPTPTFAVTADRAYAPATPSPATPVQPPGPQGASPRRPTAGRRARTRRRLIISLGTLVVFLGTLGVATLPVLLSPPHSETATMAGATTQISSPSETGAATSPASNPASSPSTAITGQTAPPSTNQPVTTPASTASTSNQSATRSGETPVPWIVALIAGLAALIALLGWYLPKIVRLARGRGVGAAPLGTLVFDVAVGPLSLRVEPRPWRTTPPRARVLRSMIAPALWFATEYPRGGWNCRHATATALSRWGLIEWEAPRPKASSAWWHRGRSVALGVLRDPGRLGEVGAEPWERVLVANLSPDAAGRIEWVRLVEAEITLPFASLVPGSTLVAPAAWARALSQYYKAPNAPSLTGLLHVIGRAVATSAGPAMDVGAEEPTESGARQRIYSVTELKHPESAMVILQAEPVPADTIGADPPDDQAEKLRLGAALAADGVPAVLLLPVLPAEITDELARIITTHIGRQQGADAVGQVLLTQIRAAVAPHVAPQVLDDIVLFLNVARYRS